MSDSDTDLTQRQSLCTTEEKIAISALQSAKNAMELNPAIPSTPQKKPEIPNVLTEAASTIEKAASLLFTQNRPEAAGKF